MKLSIFLPRIFTILWSKIQKKNVYCCTFPMSPWQETVNFTVFMFYNTNKSFPTLKVLSSLRGLFNPHFTLYLHSPDVKGKFQLVRMKLLAFAKYSKHFIQNFILLNSRWMTLAVKCDEVVQNSGLQRKLLRKFKLTQNIHA